MITDLQIKKISALLTEASAAIMEIYESGNFSVSQKEDHSPLTRADLSSNGIITKGLLLITPGIPVISEEVLHLPYDERKMFSEVWILDPIDGTREFVNRNGEFCISLALVKEGKPAAGFIKAPVTGELWYALEGKGSWYVKDGKAVRLPLTSTGSKIIITISRSHHNEAEKQWIDIICDRFEAETVIQGSALKFCRLAEGTASVYPKFGPINEWDVAAGDIILREAGGEIRETSGGEMPEYNKPDLTQPNFIAYAKGVRKLIEK